MADSAFKAGEETLRNRRTMTGSILSKGLNKSLEKKEDLLKKNLFN